MGYSRRNYYIFAYRSTLIDVNFLLTKKPLTKVYETNSVPEGRLYPEFAQFHVNSRKRGTPVPCHRRIFLLFLGNHLELLGKVLPLLGFIRKGQNRKKVYLN